MTELSGVVAILNDDNEIIEYRDLGPDPVGVKREAALPVTDVKPDLLPGQYYGDPDVQIEKHRSASSAKWTVTRTFHAVTPEPPPYTIPKNLIWQRATDDEAVAMDAMLKKQTIRLQRMYDGAEVISTDSELFGTLKAGLTAAIGAERADVLLAPPAE